VRAEAPDCSGCRDPDHWHLAGLQGGDGRLEEGGHCSRGKLIRKFAADPQAPAKQERRS